MNIIPCPFCGSRESYVECVSAPCVYAVFCDGCGARGPSVERGDYGEGDDRETRDALALWGMRTGSDTLTDDQLRDRLFEVGKPSLREWCRVHEVNSAHANEFATGIRGPGSDLLKALGMKRAWISDITRQEPAHAAL